MPVRRRFVVDTPELRRVVSLPRRIPTEADAEAYARELTKDLVIKPRDGLGLRPWQGYALVEAIQNDGGYFGLSVGAGKTLLSWLLPYVLGATRPILGIPAGLRQKTFDDFRAFLGVWKSPSPVPRVVTYEELTQDGAEKLLFRLKPDLIVLDECDLLRDQSGSKVRRLADYISNELPKVVAMTGTPGRNSILDYSHLLIWALKEGAPVPLVPAECELWAAALDEDGRDPMKRPHPGALELLGGGVTLAGARSGFRDRLSQTPGVLLIDGDSCDQPLTITHKLAPEDPSLDHHFEVFRKECMTPDGWFMSDPLSWYRHGGQLGTGMYLRWNPRPPDWWLDPRREFCKFVRDKIDVGTGPKGQALHTEKQVIRAFWNHPIVQAWKYVEKKFIPNSEPVWLSGSVLIETAEWTADMSNGPGLVWVGNVEFGQALSTITGLRFYGAKGLDEAGNYIERHPKGESAILSWGANLRGRNLQYNWARNRIVNPPQSGRYLEQLFGRTHRSGQDQPVSVEILLTSGETIDAFESAWREARFGKSTNGITQKLLRAKVERAKPEITRNPYRWASRTYAVAA
jgi:hypothetical protein